MNEIYSRYTIACGIIHKSLVDVVGVLAIRHRLSMSQDPNVALAEVFKGTPNLTQSCHSVVYECNTKKIFITGTRTVQNSIVIENLDTNVLTDICLRVDDFETNRDFKRLTNVKCNEFSHGANTRCCQNCNHLCVTCNKNPCRKKCCSIVNRRNVCDHECSACEQGYTKCNNDVKVCCLNCRICINCANSLRKQQQCIILILRRSIKKMKLLRCVLAHSTNVDFENFARQRITFIGFSNCKTWEDLWDVFNDILEDYLTFLRSYNYITEDESIEKLLEMQNIFNCPISEVDVEYGAFIEVEKHADNSTLANKDDIGKIREDFRTLAETIEAHEEANIEQTG